ncbi:MAG: hypothetical protein R3326_04685 [Gemmatimonadota bacterium]|nr:hypothetical protein [Gemmatimonadota bacterium]
MQRISIYAASSAVREALATWLERYDDLDVHDGGDRAPRDLDGELEKDVLLVATDLPPAERLEILGRIWRSNHPPRVVFVEYGSDGRGPDPGRVDPEDRERCLDVIRRLIDGGSSSERISIELVLPPENEIARAVEPDPPVTASTAIA